MNKLNKNAVRPMMATPRLLLANCLTWLRRVLKGDRFDNLFEALKEEILKIEALKKAEIKMLDYGCGMMEFSSQLKSQKVITDYVGMDIFPVPTTSDVSKDSKWARYKQIPKGAVDFNNVVFDLTIVTDVLHHASEQDQLQILIGLSKASKIILIKDHFEHGYISRQLLRLADWYGNYAYGVDIPKTYFTQVSWHELINRAGLRQVSLNSHVRVHGGIFGLLIPPTFHFISVLKGRDDNQSS